MRRLLRLLACWLFGHRSICLYRHDFGGGQVTGWKCERCGAQTDEQWDDLGRNY